MPIRSILFSQPMIKAILDGRKTQTRRVSGLQEVNRTADSWILQGVGTADGKMRVVFRHAHGSTLACACPYGMVSDLLYVRETCVRFTGLPVSHPPAPWPTEAPWQLLPSRDPYEALLHKFGNEKYIAQLESASACLTVPSMLMPRRMARLWLRLTAVRVERLHEISETNALSEGACDVGAFRSIWESLHGSGSWGLNPWVWVLGFRREVQERD